MRHIKHSQELNDYEKFKIIFSVEQALNKCFLYY